MIPYTVLCRYPPLKFSRTAKTPVEANIQISRIKAELWFQFVKASIRSSVGFIARRMMENDALFQENFPSTKLHFLI